MKKYFYYSLRKDCNDIPIKYGDYFLYDIYYKYDPFSSHMRYLYSTKSEEIL